MHFRHSISNLIAFRLLLIHVAIIIVSPSWVSAYQSPREFRRASAGKYPPSTCANEEMPVHIQEQPLLLALLNHLSHLKESLFSLIAEH